MLNNIAALWRSIVAAAPAHRATFTGVCGLIAAIAGLLSLGLAIWAPDPLLGLKREQIGYILVGFWGLLPPIFFWVDWVVFGNKLEGADLEFAKHTHDLSRNIWLALVILLTALFKLAALPTP